jgi:hypothetical protein
MKASALISDKPGTWAIWPQCRQQKKGTNIVAHYARALEPVFKAKMVAGVES